MVVSLDRVPVCYGYARASTIDQEQTLDVQQEATRREWEYRWKPKGYAWGGCITDAGVSGDLALRSRPSGAILMGKMEPGDVVIFTKLDRGFRNVMDLLNCVEWFKLREITAVIMDCSVDTSTAAGMLFLTILGAFAAFERARTSERMHEVWLRRRTKGRPCGVAPYGFKLAGRKGNRYLVPDPKTREVGAQIVDWIDRGWSLDTVYIHMIELKIRRKNKKEWSKGSIWRAYQGETRLRREEEKVAKKVAKKVGLTTDETTSSLTPEHSSNGQPDGTT